MEKDIDIVDTRTTREEEMYRNAWDVFQAARSIIADLDLAKQIAQRGPAYDTVRELIVADADARVTALEAQWASLHE